jgi:hypothetical protein
VLAAGLIGARTAFPGLGATTLLTPYLYPSSLACACWLFALRFAFLGSAVPAGLWTGLTMLIHPQAGVLALVTTAPVVARLAGLGRAARYTATALVTGGFALARLVLDLGARQPIGARERFDLLAVVRLPHHLIYRAFRPEEYVMVALWALVLLAALARYRATDGTDAGRPAGWTVLLDAFVLLCLAGAIASSLGWPLALVELQTARVSAWVPLLGLLAAAAVLTRDRPWTGCCARHSSALGSARCRGTRSRRWCSSPSCSRSRSARHGRPGGAM